MKKEYRNRIKALLACLVASLPLIFSSCGNNETSSSEIQLNSFGPSFLMRGEQLKFIGTNLDKVTSVMLPSDVEVTTFVTKTATLLVIDVPNETVNGKVTLKTPQGDIVTKTNLVISEPITIAAITPAQARPGDKIKITGTYLNLVAAIAFSTNKVVTTFESQSETELEVIVPEDAQTGKIILADDQAIPNLIKSTTDFVVALPVVTSISPATVKAGGTLTIVGTNLDLTSDITFVSGIRIQSAGFMSMTATQIEIKVPDNAKDGKLILRPLSQVEVESSEMTLVVPTISTIAPNPAKNSGDITITGTDLDLITSVVLGGDKTGTIQAGGTPTQITVKVPADATDGTVSFKTAANKSVESSSALTLVVPTITSFTPTTVSTISAPSITITGTDLDVVDSVIFEGGWKAKVSGATATSIAIPVVPGGVTGKVKLKTTNGTIIESTQTLTIVPNVPDVTGVPASGVNLGDKIALTGTNMDVSSTIYFPSEKAGQWIVATQFGLKTTTTLEVVVPAGVASGTDIKVKFVTNKNEVYMSPAFTILPSVPVLVTVLYDDAIKNGFGQWGGSTDWGSTDQAREGSKSIKMTFGGNWGVAGQFGGGSLSTSGTTDFAFSAYGGVGTAGKKLQLHMKRGGSEFDKQVTLQEGKWVDFQIPLSTFGSSGNITEFFFQNPDFTGTTVYIDNVGLR